MRLTWLAAQQLSAQWGLQCMARLVMATLQTAWVEATMAMDSMDSKDSSLFMGLLVMGLRQHMALSPDILQQETCSPRQHRGTRRCPYSHSDGRQGSVSRCAVSD
mmetsp:Transcript_32042/g.70043  ORF Transcript_32042/g.70043 Transcript_32042/m.70043 type:complete len:105 (-) Transcript_32042:129-443(-)